MNTPSIITRLYNPAAKVKSSVGQFMDSMSFLSSSKDVRVTMREFDTLDASGWRWTHAIHLQVTTQAGGLVAEVTVTDHDYDMLFHKADQWLWSIENDLSYWH